jgi:predicted Holliday junction resolvase-like endonuclease
VSNNQLEEQAVDYNLFEGLEHGDLKRLIHPELHVDEFKSKLGDDADIVVLSFKVDGKEPATDLVNFIEKGYDWVVDADISSGEMDDGDYIVFVELDRKEGVVDNIVQIMEELMNLTDQKLEDWRVRYYKAHKETFFSADSLKELIPQTPEEYERLYGNEGLDEMRMAAGIRVPVRAPKTDQLQAIRAAAGII